jgi:hypothetical protein
VNPLHAAVAAGGTWEGEHLKKSKKIANKTKYD